MRCSPRCVTACQRPDAASRAGSLQRVPFSSGRFCSPPITAVLPSSSGASSHAPRARASGASITAARLERRRMTSVLVLLRTAPMAFCAGHEDRAHFEKMAAIRPLERPSINMRALVVALLLPTVGAEEALLDLRRACANARSVCSRHCCAAAGVGPSSDEGFLAEKLRVGMRQRGQDCTSCPALREFHATVELISLRDDDGPVHPDISEICFPLSRGFQLAVGAVVAVLVLACAIADRLGRPGPAGGAQNCTA